MLRRNQHNNYHIGHKAYMVTLRIEDMIPLLGELRESTDEQRVATCHLTALGEAMRKAWLTLPERYHNIVIYDDPEEYVIMPEHFHGIIYVTAYMQEHLGEIVRLFKSRVAMTYRYLLTQSENNNAANVANNAANTPAAKNANTPAANNANAPAANYPAIRAVGTANEWLKAYRALSPAEQAATRQWIEGQLAILYSATRCGTQGSTPGTQGSGPGTQGSGPTTQSCTAYQGGVIR